MSLIAALTLLTTAADAKTLVVDKSRTVYLKGEVGGNAFTLAREIINLADKSHDDIYMVINSPGGNVITGMQLLSAMRIAQSRGIQFHCVVPNLAASMAFVTLAQCDHRYAFENSLLLWHPMRMSSRSGFTREEAKAAEEDMRRLELPLMRMQWKALGISWSLFHKHYKLETLWAGGALNKAAPGFMQLIDDVEGVEDLFSVQ
jgi:ATP-dependent protease ClpP protease subunit